MNATLTRLWGFLPRLSWLTGPILDKELRVTSRRRRHYVMRFIYIVAMTGLVALVWLASAGTMERRGTDVYTISRMAEVGKTVVSSIVWFEFLIAQLLAIVLLSTSISDEVYGRTLGVLMTTPITGLQIVLGKLLGRMLQLLLLLAISLPLLAVVRVFGGVPWQYILAGLCMTLSTALLLGSVSMFFSIRTRRAYGVILKVLLVCALVYLLVPMLLAYSFARGGGGGRGYGIWQFLLYLNPFAGMGYLHVMMQTPVGAPFSYHWPVSCGINLAGAALVLAACAKMVRKAGMRQATGQLETWSVRRRSAAAAKLLTLPAPATAGVATPPPLEAVIGRIRRVGRWPVLWKELRTPLLPRRPLTIVLAILFVVAALITYAVFHDEVTSRAFHIVSCIVLALGALIATATLAATSITTEKESQTWPLLLITGQSDWQILWGKAVGTMRRCLLMWVPLWAHVVIFTLFGVIHPYALVNLLAVMAAAIVFLVGGGLYWSSRLRRTTSAVVANMLLGLTLWAAVPFVWAMAHEIVGFEDREVTEAVLSGNPVYQVGVIMNATAGWSYRSSHYPYEQTIYMSYDWFESEGFGGTMVLLTIWLAVYTMAGFILAMLAKARFRKKIF